MVKVIVNLALIVLLTTVSIDGRSLKCSDRRTTNGHNNDIVNNQIDDSFLHLNLHNWKTYPIMKFLSELGEKQVKKVIKFRYNYSKIFNEIKHGIETRLTCDTCELVLSLAHISVYSVEELNYLMASVCHSFHFENSRVCQGLSDLFSEELYFILRHTNLTRNEMCATLIGADCLSDRCAHRIEAQLSIKIEEGMVSNRDHSRDPSKHIDSVQYSRRSQNYQILHLSDLHIDPFYDPGASSDCGEPLCCRPTSASGKDKAGFWGDYHSCDSPKYTIKQLMTYINETMSERFQYVIWTGDIVAHDVWNTTRMTIINGSKSLTSLIKRYISNGKQVFPVIGNHEGLPVNQFPPPKITGHLSIGWLYSELLNQWSDWIPSEYANTFKTYGYYANKVSAKLKVIVLNTNYCARLNFWLMYDPRDPGNQLQWLSNELQESESKGQSVHILGHIPPDNTQCISLWVHNYLRIIEIYSETIKGQFFGHTHFDEIRLLYSTNNTSNLIGTAYLTPSVTTYEGVNPSFRLYTIDEEATVLDHHNYYLNLTEANIYRNETSLQWIEEYSAKVSYNMSSLVSSEWEAVYQKMRSDDLLFQRYYNHYHRYSDAFDTHFDPKFKQSILDSIPIVDPIPCKK